MVGTDKLAGDGLMGNGAQAYKEAKLFSGVQKSIWYKH